MSVTKQKSSLAEFSELLKLTKRHIAHEYLAESKLFVSESVVKEFSPWLKARPMQQPPPPSPVSKAKLLPKQRPANRKKLLPPPPAPKKPAAKPKAPDAITREAAAEVIPVEFGELRKLLTQFFPRLQLLSEPLDDTGARKEKEAWKERSQIPTVAVLLGENDSLTLFTNIARALHRESKSAGVVSIVKIDQEMGWSAFFEQKELQIVLGTETTINEHPELRLLLSKNRLANMPFIQLPSLLSTAEEKRTLWKLLKREILS